MKAMRIASDGSPGVLAPGNCPQPRPAPGELLIRVHAAGVTTSELDWYPSTHTAAGDPRKNAIPGHEFSGVVSSTGQEVYGMNDWYADGATAEYCIAKPSAVAPKPATLTHVQAASVPIGALTAWQGLFDRAALKAGERVLVQGGAGAVGIFAVQLARNHGARVTATASARDAAFVSHLGAEQVIDYHSRFEDFAGKVDVVFDTVGGETLERSFAMLKPNGRMVTIVSIEEKTVPERIRQAFFIVSANGKQLAEIGSLIDGGKLMPAVAAVVPLHRAADAYSGKVVKQTPGKLVVEIGDLHQ